MGNVNEIINSNFDKDANYIFCCKNNKAKYRCQYVNHKIKNYNNMITVKDLELLDDNLKADLIELTYYWHTSTIGLIKWIACDNCINDSVRKYFTYHPFGWKENIKHHYDYEEIEFR